MTRRLFTGDGETYFSLLGKKSLHILHKNTLSQEKNMYQQKWGKKVEKYKKEGIVIPFTFYVPTISGSYILFLLRAYIPVAHIDFFPFLCKLPSLQK